ncbi:MAG: hypothetical protein H0T79_02240 [Deltaproteobacteria bacterium]|nr:hypothetical protein [Deltaproteobacteria bacterium]
MYADALQRAGDPRGELIALQAAAAEHPTDAAIATAVDRHLAAHELYLLGALAPGSKPGTVAIWWRLGFVDRVDLSMSTTAEALAILDIIATLPSCRLLRELAIMPATHRPLDDAAIGDRLVALGRPATLSQLMIGTPRWSVTPALRRAFPRLADADLAIDKVLATARTGGVIPWNRAARLTAVQAQQRVARIATRLATPDAFGIEVDPAVFATDAAVVGGGRVRELVVPAERTVFIEGDLTVEGVFEQAFRSAPVLVFGNLTCGSVCTSGYLVVMGDLVVADVFYGFYGASTNYGTHVFGDVRIATLVLEDDHHLGTHRGMQITRTELLAVEHLQARGLDLETQAHLVAGLRGVTAGG